ncbi:MAG: hypothetical protein V3S04_02380, partial [Candidatus Omnitrophota bacterium]
APTTSLQAIEPKKRPTTDLQGIEPQEATGRQHAVKDAEAAVDLMIRKLKGMREDEDIYWRITYDINRLSPKQRDIIERSYRMITGLGEDRLKIIGNNRRGDKDEPLISVERWRKGADKPSGEGHIRVPADRDISQLRVLNALNIAMALASASKDLTAQEIKSHRLMGIIESQYLAITGKPFDPSSAQLDIRTVILKDLPEIKPEDLDDYERAMEAVLRAV